MAIEDISRILKSFICCCENKKTFDSLFFVVMIFLQSFYFDAPFFDVDFFFMLRKQRNRQIETCLLRQMSNTVNWVVKTLVCCKRFSAYAADTSHLHMEMKYFPSQYYCCEFFFSSVLKVKVLGKKLCTETWMKKNKNQSRRCTRTRYL